MEKQDFQDNISSRQCHMILQKSLFFGAYEIVFIISV